MPLGISYLFLANPSGAAGPPGPQELALFSMERRFALLDLEAKAYFSQDDQKTSANKKKKKKR
jgi:hypothetical protein